MTLPTSDLKLSVADLVGRPGQSRHLRVEVAAPEEVDRPIIHVPGLVTLDGVLESVVDGILLRGELSATIQAQCSRCLTDIEQPLATDVVELFRDPAEVDPDDELEPGYEIIDTQIDLDVMLRDALAPALPYSPLCTQDCKGLCPSCGTDLNTSSCDCTDTSTNDRWAALEALRLPPGDSGADEDVERGNGG